MRPISGFSITLIAILLSKTWSLPDPKCYEPTSGSGPALDADACIKTGLKLVEHYPLSYYFLTHGTPPNPHYIQCPLKIEIDNCLFIMDYDGSTRIPQVNRGIIVDAILNIEDHCIGEDKNADGGQIVESLGDQIYIKYSLQHPQPQLTGMNSSSVGDSQPNENFVLPAHPDASLVRSGDVNSSFMAFDR